MQADKRAERDARIMRDVRAGRTPRALAGKYRLTYARIHQIVVRETGRRKRRKK